MFASAGWAVWVPALAFGLGLPVYAWRVRSRAYGGYAAVLLALCLPGALLVHAQLRSWAGNGLAIDLLTSYGVTAAGVHLVALVRPRLRPRGFRWAVSIPGQAFLAGGFLCGAWLLALWPLRALLWALGQDAAHEWVAAASVVPVAICALSLVTSLRLRRETVRIELGEKGPSRLERASLTRTRGFVRSPELPRPLRIAQIADPHLGPWQPEHRLRRRVELLVQQAPDLVLLTGDLLTMEGQGSPGALARALRPLRELPGRCYAILGNHDLEAPEQVEHALTDNGTRLLIDEAQRLETPAGPVQLIGANYVWREREKHLQTLLERFPREPDCLRLLMLHDPAAFAHVPDGEADLTLSGHTHGGQLGLVSLGMSWTVLSRTRWPDHGLFVRGANRLYVHRGTGFYGFPMRVGVPGEHSVLEVVR